MTGLAFECLVKSNRLKPALGSKGFEVWVLGIRVEGLG